MKRLSFGLLLFVILLNNCKSKQGEQSNDSTLTLQESKETGLSFSNELKDTKDQNITEYLYYYNGGGVGVGDINNDGLEDVFFTSNQGQDKLFLNKGNLKFEDITSSAGIVVDNGWSTGVTIDDVNSDGLKDIYVCRVNRFCSQKNNHNLLYINQGEGKFKESASLFGVDFKGYGTQSAFLDYDHDGDLDLYLLNHTVHSVRSYGDVSKRLEKDSLSGDLFFENRIKEEGKFVNVTEKAGVYNSPLGYGLAITTGDINNDGWTDIYIGNDFHENDYLYINNGDKTFSESIRKATTHTSQFSMGVDMADLNNDGWTDIFTTDMMPYDANVAKVSGGEDTDNVKRLKKSLGFEDQNARNHMQINRGDGTFSDIGYMTKTFATDWSWSVLMQDFDNSGSNDVFITSGIVKRPNDLEYLNFLTDLDAKSIKLSAEERARKLIEKMPSQALKNILFRQKGDLVFSDLNNSFIGKESFSTGAAYADFDNDGDLDVVTNNINEEVSFYKNNSIKNNITINLKNDNSTSLKGTKITLYENGKKYFREYQTVKGFLSSSSHKIHFGLGDAKKVDSIKICWPDYSIQTIINPKLNQTLIITKNTNVVFSKTMFAAKYNDVEHITYFQHQENKFYDENNEKLILERLSYDGPAFLCEDLTKDGIKDFYVGGGRNQPAHLFIGTKAGTFVEKKVMDFINDAKYEDTDAALIDFDADGDKDLYVVSGGNDNKELDKINEDRIYLNNGNGDFRRIPISLPHTNGSVIAVADVDGDGYEDMFVGARSIPGSYGLSPYSFVLKNMNGQALKVIDKQRHGMITDAKWADIDGDKDLDLVICGDWMSMVVMINEKGILKEKSKDYGFEEKGFWNCIELFDFNKDGKLDIIGGNSGLNQKLLGSKQAPIKMHIGDFDQNGSSDPLVFYKYFNGYLPFASLDKLISQLPILKKKFIGYKSFKEVQEIKNLFENYQKSEIEYKEVNENRSLIYLSENGKYVAYPLSFNEQLSDIQDIHISSNGDVHYVGNNHDYVSELGKSSSNEGRKLSGFDLKTKTFLKSERLVGLPNGINARKIQALDPTSFLVAVNNDYIYKVRN
jgi:enediyne biosynthesis protein E4